MLVKQLRERGLHQGYEGRAEAMTYPASGTLRFRSKPALAGAGLIFIAGLIHLLLTP